MSLIPDESRDQIKNQLDAVLLNPVRVLMFTQQMECRFCSETKQLIMELAALNSKIQAEVHDFVADSQMAKDFGIEMVPALVIMGEKDYGIRFYGLPFGYEFQTLLHDLVIVSRGETDLAEQTKQALREIKVPLNIKVFVTLTCPHCPVAAAISHKFALENSLIKSEVIDISEFPQLAVKYGVLGIPKVVINEKTEFVGALPENAFLAHVMQAVQSSTSP